jgi:rhamnosyltransferase subunit B
MPKVLLTYEFGAGLGHLNRLMAVAKRLPEKWETLFAIPDPATFKEHIARSMPRPYDLREGVVWRAPNDPNARRVPTHTFADVISLFAFGNVEVLSRHVATWDKVLAEYRPDLIIADFAPTICLAADGKQPILVVGNGYTIPPGSRMLPPMRPWETHVQPQSRSQEAALLMAVNRVRQRSKGPAIDYFADLFHGTRTFPCTLPEFDPYQRFRTNWYWPFNIPDIAAGPGFDEREGPAIFVYLAAQHPALRATIEAANKLGRRVQLFVQGAEPTSVARLCASNVAIHTKPADFAKILPQTSLLLHHAGLGTAYAGLAAGVPQLVMPLNLEHWITAVGLDQFRTGIRLQERATPSAENLLKACVTALESEENRLAALAAGRTMRERRVPDPVAPVVQACVELL